MRWSWRPARILALGARGERVRALQETLAGLGFDPGPIDGKYGLLTRHAVRECQRRYGLLADGVAGPQLQRLFREPALRLGPTQALLGVVPEGEPGPLERWAAAYPALSAVIWPTRLVSWDPAPIREAASAWAAALEAAGAGTPSAPPWIWRIVFRPPDRFSPEPEERREREDGEAAADAFQPFTSGPRGRARRELVTVLTRLVDRFRPLGVDLDLEPVLPGDGRRWLRLLAALRQVLERRGILLLATRDTTRRPRVRPAWVDDLPTSLLLQQVHLLILTRRAAPGMPPPGAVGTGAMQGILAGIRPSQAYKVLLELPLESARWTQGGDQPLTGPEPLTYREARVVALQRGRRIRWDEEAGAASFRLRGKHGMEQYWLASARGVEHLLEQVAARRLAGVVLAPLGAEDPRLGRFLPGPLTPWQPQRRESGDIPPAAGA